MKNLGSHKSLSRIISSNLYGVILNLLEKLLNWKTAPSRLSTSICRVLNLIYHDLSTCFSLISLKYKSLENIFSNHISRSYHPERPNSRLSINRALWSHYPNLKGWRNGLKIIITFWCIWTKNHKLFHFFSLRVKGFRMNWQKFSLRFLFKLVSENLLKLDRPDPSCTFLRPITICTHVSFQFSSNAKPWTEIT